MFSQNKSAKAKSLKRRVQRDLHELVQDEKVKLIIEGPKIRAMIRDCTPASETWSNFSVKIYSFSSKLKKFLQT